MHKPILKRAGIVLIVVGIVDIAAMIYCISQGISYSSSFNIFAIVAGIFLLRGSLRAASIIRWLSVFMFTSFVSLIIAWPLIRPMDLTLTHVKLYPGIYAVTAIFLFFVLGLLFWLFTKLGCKQILEAHAKDGGKQRDMRIAAVAGVALVVALCAISMMLQGSESINRAKSIAEQQIGSGYKFHASTIRVTKSSTGVYSSGVVTAWNSHEIKYIPVEWHEK